MPVSRPPAQTMPVRRHTPSPNARAAPYPARSPLPGYSQPSPYSNGHAPSAQPSPAHNGRMNGDRSNGEHGYPEQRGYDGRNHDQQGNHLPLPPLSSIERVADHYRRDQSYRMKEPVSLPAAPSSFPRPRQMLQPPPDHRRPANGHDAPQGRRQGGVVTEAEIQQKRALLVEGRKWIFSMLDETTAMLRQLDEASLHMNGVD